MVVDAFLPRIGLLREPAADVSGDSHLAASRLGDAPPAPVAFMPVVNQLGVAAGIGGSHVPTLPKRNPLGQVNAVSARPGAS